MENGRKVNIISYINTPYDMDLNDIQSFYGEIKRNPDSVLVRIKSPVLALVLVSPPDASHEEIVEALRLEDLIEDD